MKEHNCRFREPYRNEKTRRPHPSKASVCAFPVKLPVLPNAYGDARLTPMPVYPLTCSGCRCYEPSGMRFHQPHAQMKLGEATK